VTQEIKVGNQTTLSITLQEDAQSLEEVVVVGYGTQKRASITGSVASIQTKDIVSVKVPNVTNALAGKLPGLRAVQRSGAPGDDAASIDIRGYGSALIIVDGVERSFSMIDANDIESISILKDASAAVYGFKGANGVILVTTKKGETHKPKISYNGYYGFQNITRFPDFFNAYEYASLYNEGQLNIGMAAPYSQEDLEKYKIGADATHPNTDWKNLTFQKNAPEMYHNLSVSGGTEKVKYFMSLGFTDQEGIYSSGDYNYDKYNVRSNVSAEIVKGLNIGLELSGNFDTRNKPYDQEVFKSVFQSRPLYPVYANNQAPYWYNPGNMGNPLQIIKTSEVGYDKRDRRQFNGSLTAKWDLPWVQGLSVKALLSYDYDNINLKQWFKEYAEYRYDAVQDTYNKTDKHALSTLTMRTDYSYVPTQQYSVNYQNVFGAHDVGILLLWEMRNWRNDWFSAYRQFYIGAIDQMNAGDNANKNNGGTASEGAREGLVGRFNYAYSNKYLAELSFRYDGSYKFAADKRWGFFPAVSLGWRISEEPFFKDKISFVDNLKIRGSYGKIGDEGDFSAFQYLSGYNYPNGSWILGSDGLSNGANDKGLPNTSLTWYESTTANIGFEFSASKGIISLEFDLFERRRDGLLASRLLTLPATFGKSLPQENINSDRTRGFEILLGHRNKIGDVNYSVSANFTSTRELNRYVERAASGNMYLNWRNNTTDRYKSITWGYEAEGQFKSFEEILNAPIQDGNGNKSLLPGDIRYKDVNNDNIIDDKDKIPIGHSNVPSMYYGLNLTFDWKGIDFTAFFQGAGGHEQYMQETFNDPFIQVGMGNGTTLWLDRWHRENPEDLYSAWIPGLMPAIRPTGFSLNNQTSTWYLLKEDYLRLKTIELGYTLPGKWLTKAGIENVRIYVNSYNPLTFTRGGVMKYMDPENSNTYLQYYPQMKSYNFGINLLF
jgi:TonB-linked SusC/RagA family outer membrane protein